MSDRDAARQVPDLSQWIRPGDTVLWGQAAAEPVTLTRALVAQRAALGPLTVFLGIGFTDTVRPEHVDHLRMFGYGASGRHRELAAAGVMDVLPCHYSQIPRLLGQGWLKPDVVLLQVSPPNADGRYSFGMANEYLPGAVESARVVLAESSHAVPWTHGEHDLGADDFDLLVTTEMHPPQPPLTCPSPVDAAIGRYVSDLIEEGATLQVGIGAIPDAVLAALKGHRNLGLHSGAVGDGIVELQRCGVLTNARKEVDTGMSVVGHLLGSKILSEWAQTEPSLRLRATTYTHDPVVLGQFRRLVAINSAIEVDLSGQVNAEVADGRYVGAVGGAVDFLRAAGRSERGLPIVALPSSARGASRIVAKLSGPVSTARSDAGLIVTEYGVADLRGQPLKQRAQRLTAIAHPDHREALLRASHGLT